MSSQWMMSREQLAVEAARRSGANAYLAGKPRSANPHHSEIASTVSGLVACNPVFWAWHDAWRQEEGRW